MDPQEQLPKKSVVPVFVERSAKSWCTSRDIPCALCGTCPNERLPRVFFRGSGDRVQEVTHFSSGRVDVESFPARDTVPLRIDGPAQVRIDLELFPARGHDSVAFNLEIAGQKESHFSAGRIDVELFRARGQDRMAIRPYVVGRIRRTATCGSDFPSPRSPIGATPLAVTQ